MVRNALSTNIHTRLISVLVNKFVSEGYEVSADHIGYPNGEPKEWKGYIPDIHAIKGTKELFIEAETCDTLDNVETKLQWITLSSKPDVEFSVIIPKNCLEEAKELAKKWNVEVKDFWSMKIE